MDYMTYIRWLAGAHCFLLEATIPQGKRHRDVKLQVSAEDLLAAADALPRNGIGHHFTVVVKRGRGQQSIPICLDRTRLVAIAAAIRDVPASEIGHRLYHYENPGTPFPCESCAVTLDAKRAAADRAREKFVKRWATELRVRSARIERLLAEYDRLPPRSVR